MMLEEKMYVRCPADYESITDPRVFVCGQIIKVDRFKKTVSVKINDPFGYLMFFEHLPHGVVEYPEDAVKHCTFFLDSTVVYKGENYKVLTSGRAKDSYYYYYLQNSSSKEIILVSERDIVAAFNNGRIDPALQLRNYEFQNPAWYLGHAIVSKSMNVLENSIYGFKELAGSKIYLLPHQVNSIMRCLQDEPCRYMLADEVGMGKTIEAISVFKIYMQNRSNRNALIIVPDALKEQWKTELFFKFNIELGKDINENSVTVKTLSEIDSSDLSRNWDFVIVDEVHRYLASEEKYRMLHRISHNTRNILLLSATPVQQRKEEYLSLLRLLLPDKYDSYTIEGFSDLIEKQSGIIQKTALILDDLGDLEEEIGSVEDDDDPHESEDCGDLFEEIQDGLEEIVEDLDDERLQELFEAIDFEDDDLGVYRIKVIISYICSNYQIESNIIRNRRKILEVTEDGTGLLPTRELETITYDLDSNRNTYETLTYEALSDWIITVSKDCDSTTEQNIRLLLESFFSSPWAFKECLVQFSAFHSFNPEVTENAARWTAYEDDIVNHIQEIIDDPDQFADFYSSRIVTVMNALYEEYYNEKIVLFTNYESTFSTYRKVLETLFSSEEISFFGNILKDDELELNAYRFQNDRNCRIMLCDYTGGEGRNFQCADYILHIDLPWDANMIEQRIGRLDRLERDPERPIVHSVVVYSKETFEEALFNFWNEGLKIFTQSLSGMEIIMNDVNNEILAAVKDDFRYGLFNRIPQIINLAEEMRLTVRKEQNYDAAGFVYKPMYNELRRLITYYSENENDIFADTMRNWASLAGFHGSGNQGVVSYSAQSFVPKSAINALLIPPKWNDYVASATNKFVSEVQSNYDTKNNKKPQVGTIKGTFVRKLAIENDYLHFFAPGDAVFDCIVENAMHSCKGQVAAFAYLTSVNWMGIIYTWSLTPNIEYLLKNGVSLYAMSSFRNYMMSEQVVVPISMRNDESLSDEQIVRVYNELVGQRNKPNNIVHLGKRGSTPGILKGIVTGSSNVGWFKQTFSEDEWGDIVDTTRQKAVEKAKQIFIRRSNLRGAKEEMSRILSAKSANAEYYELSDQNIEDLENTHKIILEAIKHTKLVLDSAAFVWMVKKNDD